MKINTNDFIVESNVSTPMQNFSISDMSLVMELLSKLYNNPRQTLTQEYISNARDANRESGSTRPIEIKAPTLLDSTMVIRDFGLGISPDRMEKVFKSYGTSTKRDTNNQVGGFGIGSKSAFSYTDSFAITTFIDGIKRDYLAHKTAKAGGLTLLSEAPTSEANGTAISIAVKGSDLEIFRKAISRTTFFWSKQEYPIITGMEIIHHSDNKEIVLDKTLSVYKEFPNYLEGSGGLVVIDGIPYPMPRDLYFRQVRSNYAIRIPNSILNIAPSREALVDNDHNLKVLKSTISKLELMAVSYIKDNCNKPDHKVSDWLELNKLLTQVPNKFGYVYHSRYSNDEISYEGKEGIFSKVVLPRRGNGVNFRLADTSTAGIESLYYDDIKESRLARLFRLKKIPTKYTTYLINPSLATLDKVLFDKLKDDLKAIPLSQIDISDYVAPTKESRAQGIKKPINQVSVNYYPNSVLVRTNIKAEDIPSGTVYISMESKEYENRTTSSLITYLKDTKVEFIFASKHTYDKLTKVKELVSLDTWVKNHKISINEINTAIRNILGKADWLRSITGIQSLLKDDILASLVSYVSLPVGKYITLPNQFTNQITDNKEYQAAKKLQDKINTIAVKYPLLSVLANAFKGSKQEYKDHVVKYINSNARNKNV